MASFPRSATPRLVDNIIAFARTLRTAGVRLGPAQVLDALHCVQAVGPVRREHFYWALRAPLVRGSADGEIFDQAFEVFFRNPHLLDQVVAATTPSVDGTAPSVDEQVLRRRLAEAFSSERPPARALPTTSPGATSAASTDREVFRQRDFAEMSAHELEQARAAIAQLVSTLPQRSSRRRTPAPRRGRIDLRTTLRGAHRHAGELISLARTAPASRDVPIVLLCDISGSMARYSRLFLHFAHALTARRREVYSFVFATRLSHVTPGLSAGDADHAVARVCAQVQDWSGGTRIGRCLREFNYHWARRVLSDRAIVVLLSDGLERELTHSLATEAARLGRSAARWIWLNPLLRYAAFEPRAAGIRAMLPHVSDLRPAHNLHSLAALAQLLVVRPD